MAAQNEFTLLTAATSAAAPSAATDGVSLDGADAVELRVRSASGVGSGTMTATLRVWLYSATDSIWYPATIGSGAGDTANTAGWMNGGAAIEEIAADALRHTERVEDLQSWARIYVQIVALGGSGTAMTVVGRRLFADRNGRTVG